MVKIDAAVKRRIVEAIRLAERETSGEIRVHLASRSVEDAYVEARKTFKRLGMHATSERNGVLIYVAPHSKNFAIVGDAGLDAKVGPEFWDRTRDRMAAQFSTGRLAEGIIEGVYSAAEKLREHFPRRKDDANELSDTVTEG